jgi:hypothetical protein
MPSREDRRYKGIEKKVDWINPDMKENGFDSYQDFKDDRDTIGIPSN